MYKKLKEFNEDSGYTRKPYAPVKDHVKSRIVSSILSKELTLRKAAFKYKSNRRTISKWVNEAKVNGLLNAHQSITENPLNLKMNNKQVKTAEVGNYKVLVDALKREKLKTEALKTMIEIAEQNFKIKIRKKAGTKQCKP